MTKINFNGMWPTSIGFESLMQDVEKMLNHPTTNTYPPHNVIKLSDTDYVCELAIAGFRKSEVTIKQVEDLLEIRGVNSDDDKEIQYLHKGISNKSFCKSFKLMQTVEITGAVFKDGILSINLTNNVPESKQPKYIDITDDINDPVKEMLLERNKSRL